MIESSPAATMADARAAIRVCAPGRLHLGFLDPSGSLGRRFGSVGLVIEGFETEVVISSASEDAVFADTPAARAEVDRAAACLQRLRERTGRRDPLALRLRRALPAHAGFGSGTQLALAVGPCLRALARPEHCHDHPGAVAGPWPALGHRHRRLRPWRPARRWRARCRRRAGAAARARGAAAGLAHCRGDGRARARPVGAPTSARRSPALPPLPQAQAADICHQVLMRVLPGAAEARIRRLRGRRQPRAARAGRSLRAGPSRQRAGPARQSAG